MYERFTDRARRVMQLANQEAQRFNHEYIGTEHILLGLVKEGSGVAATVLGNRDIKLRKVRLEVEKLVQSGPEMITMGKLPQTPRAKKTLEYSMEEARNLGHSHVGTEHLLLGLIREGDGVACQVLTELGLEIEQLRLEIVELTGSEEYKKEKRNTPKKSKTPALDAFTKDINEQTRGKKLTPVIGRKKEIDRLTTVLLRRDRNCAILVSQSGSGKRSIVHGLAQQIVEGSVRQLIAEYRIVELKHGEIVAGTKYRGQFEERITAMINEMRRAKNVVLYVPQIHLLARLGVDEETGLSAFDLLKFAMKENQIKCVGTCSDAEYEEFISHDSDLKRLFQLIPVVPPSKAETLEILAGIKSVYEKFHHVEIRKEAIQAAVELSDIYLPNAVLPEKAINLIDEASARLVPKTLPADLSENTVFGVIDVPNVVAALSLETGISEQDIADGKSVPERLSQ